MDIRVWNVFDHFGGSQKSFSRLFKVVANFFSSGFFFHTTGKKFGILFDS